jgi:AraC family transcriptional regulator, dual regulator of chb operon
MNLGELNMDLYRITEIEHIDADIGVNPNFLSSIRFTSPVHCHDFYEFFLITKGQCIHRVNGVEQHLTEGTLVFIRPEDLHYYDYYEEEDCQFINIACAKQIINDAFKYLGDELSMERFLRHESPPYVTLPPLERDNLVRRYERLKLLLTIDKAQARIQVRALVLEMLTQCFLSSQNTGKKEVPLWFEALLMQMQKKENFTKGLERMYELSGRSIGHLNRVFQQYLNITPTLYINQLRLSCAKSLLLNTELTIVEVAMEAGFENLSHFYHLFRETFNATPASMRVSRGKHKKIQI